jgi:2-hydroxychromene-2-carboxylate isomerase
MKMFDDPRHEQDPALVARHFLDKASAIYVFGFDFHDQNVELLNLSDSNIANLMTVLNYANSHGLRSRALQAGVSEQKIWRHASGNYEIAQAIDDGIFEA